MTEQTKKGLENLPQAQAPDIIWNHIETELDKEKKHRVIPFWLWSGMGAAAGIVLIAAFWVLFSEKEEPLVLKQENMSIEIAPVPAPELDNNDSPELRSDETNEGNFKTETNAEYTDISSNWTFGTASGALAEEPIYNGFYNSVEHDKKKDIGKWAKPGTYTVADSTYPAENPLLSEGYASLIENEYADPYTDPLSTFSIDVDNASYTNTRRMLLAGQKPPKDAVRIEEFINYFDYRYAKPEKEDPFSINLETASCPWNKDTRIVMIGLQGKDVDRQNLPASNLVFLIDVSGSMSDPNKLPLVKSSLKLLVDEMRPQDRIAIVTYAGSAGLVLPSTPCSQKENIKNAIDHLESGGSTAGGEGLVLAYRVASAGKQQSGNNRIVLVTDGDFNVGLSTNNEMKDLIERERKSGIFLTVCGFGMGNYKDDKMEILADQGNGNYYYIDDMKEGKKVFVTDLTGTLFTIAKDVKIQVEFNPRYVKAYRLIGYENRRMPPQDFADDTKDAGELGAGHRVTALYEIIPAGSKMQIPGFTELKYQERPRLLLRDFGDEMLTVKLRYKKPEGETSILLERTLKNNSLTYHQASENFRLACGVTAFGMLLRDSKFKANATYGMAKELVKSSKLPDPHEYKAELITLIEKAEKLK